MEIVHSIDTPKPLYCHSVWVRVCYVSIAWLTMFWCSLNEIKGVSPGVICHKTHWKVLFLVLIRWFNDILFLPYFKIGEYIGIYLWKLYVNSQEWPNYTVTSTLKLADCHWKLVEMTLYIGTHDIRQLWKWYRYPALNGFQKAKSIQCYTRQIISKLGQINPISNKKGSLVN